MATNWVILTGPDVQQVISVLAQSSTNENLGDSVAPGDELDLAADNRRDKCVVQAVAEVRGAIQSCGRRPLSVTAGAVPPEGEFHALVLAAWRLVNSTPGLARSFLAGDGGAETPLAKMYRDAKEWVWGAGTPKQGGLAQGASSVEPTDPTGQDYLTAVDNDPSSASYNPAIRGVRWGDSSGTDIDYARGYAIDPISGAEIPLPENMKI